jgi:hypothetical protein
VLFAPVEDAVGLQPVEVFQGMPIHAEQFTLYREHARLDRGREVAQIEQVEAAAGSAGADEPAGCKEVVVAEAALQRTINENMDHCASAILAMKLSRCQNTPAPYTGSSA